MSCPCPAHQATEDPRERRARLDRRALVLGVGALGLTAGTSSASSAKTLLIDVHHHFLPPQYLKEAPPSGDVQRHTGWTPDRTLEEMDRNGVAISMLSFPTPFFWFDGVQPGRRLARLCNDYCGDLVRQRPRRFGMFAGVPPLGDTEGALQEIAYAFDVLKADGVAVMSSYGGRYLGDMSFTPVWDELNHRAAVVFVHPAEPACCRAVEDGAPNVGYLELPFDTARTVLSLWMARAQSKWPRIRFIFSHGGGALPMVADRIDKFGRPTSDGSGAAHDGAAFFRGLYFDTANAASPAALSATRAIAGPGRVLFGTDYPYVPTRRILDGLEQASISPAERQGIESGNALALLPQLQSRLR